MQPKSQCRAYVGYNDGSNSILYYNATTRKILKSGNYRFLTPPKNDSPPEGIEVAPDSPPEGEDRGSARLSEDLINPDTGDKRKRGNEDLEDDLQNLEPKKLRAKRPNYFYLNDPYSDEEDILTSEEHANSAIIPGDELNSLAEARRSPDWPEW